MKTIYLEVIKHFIAIAASVGADLLSMFQFAGRGAVVQLAFCAAVFALVAGFAISSRGPRIIALRAYVTLALLAGLALAASIWRTAPISNG